MWWRSPKLLEVFLVGSLPGDLYHDGEVISFKMVEISCDQLTGWGWGWGSGWGQGMSNLQNSEHEWLATHAHGVWLFVPTQWWDHEIAF